MLPEERDGQVCFLIDLGSYPGVQVVHIDNCVP